MGRFDHRLTHDRLLKKKLKELAEQVEKHNHLVHKLVKNSDEIFKRSFLSHSRPSIPNRKHFITRYPYMNLQRNLFSHPTKRYSPQYRSDLGSMYNLYSNSESLDSKERNIMTAFLQSENIQDEDIAKGYAGGMVDSIDKDLVHRGEFNYCLSRLIKLPIK